MTEVIKALRVLMETMLHYFNSGHFYKRTRKICAIFVEDIMRRISAKFPFFNSKQCLRGCLK